MDYSKHSLRLLVPGLLAVLASACVAKNPDNLGNVAEGTSDDGTDPTGDTGQAQTSGNSATSSDDMGTATAADTGEAFTCPDPSTDPYVPAACPDDVTPQLPSEGCYEACDGPGGDCSAGVCTLVQTNPCVCAEGEDCCAACASLLFLCVEWPSDEVCEQIIGTTFHSVEDLECGLGPMGVELCPWTIDFAVDGSFIWTHSDVGEGGNYSCIGGTLAITNGPMVDFSYDPGTGILNWDGVDYAPAP